MILNYMHWNPNPELFNLFGISIRYYSLLFVGGLIICLQVLKWIFKQEKLATQDLEKLATYGFIGIFAGARLGHCLFYEPAYYLAHPLEMILPIHFPPEGGFELRGFSGLASHGGTLGLIVALLIYSRKTKISILYTIDLIAIVAALGAGFIRLANFMNSEIVGLPSTKPWTIVFERVDLLPRHPAQLYEALSYFIIFAIMFGLYKWKGIQKQSGFYFGLVIFLIFIARFFIEFVKERQVDFEAGMLLDMGQILSIPYILLGLGFMLYSVLRKTSITI